MTDALTEKRIAQVTTVDIGKTSGIWRYGSIDQSPAVFESRLRNGLVVTVDRVANTLFLCTDAGNFLALGYLSGRITYHAPGAEAPKNSCLRVRFDDDSTLSVVISLWGLIRALRAEDRAAFVAKWYGHAIEPNSEQCTWEGFRDAVDQVDDPKLSAKKFLHAFEPGYYLSGLDSGYAIEILHRARIHPKRALVSLTRAEQKACYASADRVMDEGIRSGGRVSEVDLYGRPGNFLPHVCSLRVGQPCLECGTPITKFSFEGGSCYACTTCQPLVLR
ncbi:MAG: hypothetical protein WDA75_07445 [Candidatus Latescibacterota bacterium]|jgi:formamidopyrimidine-DNA glycosylase